MAALTRGVSFSTQKFDWSDPMTPAHNQQTATIISDLTGNVIGGRVVESSDDGTVVILFAGMERAGKRLTSADIKSIEAGEWTGTPLLRAQRSAKSE